MKIQVKSIDLDYYDIEWFNLFKKIRYTRGIFHAKMGTIKDKSSMNLTKAEDTKKRWHIYTELYKKYLNYPDNYNGVITHLEPDILE